MMLFQNKYRIESARLSGWDYSTAGYYFVTVCTHDRGNLFGEIIDDKMALNDFGKIVCEEWVKSFEIRRELVQDEFVVMPNHFHGIVRLVKIADQFDVCVDANGYKPVNVVENVNVVETSGRTSLPEREREREPERTPRIRPKSISSFMAGLKSVITKQINIIRVTPGADVLQYRFHDHIIRDKGELFKIRQYIRNNPSNWKKDKFNSDTGNAVHG